MITICSLLPIAWSNQVEQQHPPEIHNRLNEFCFESLPKEHLLLHRIVEAHCGMVNQVNASRSMPLHTLSLFGVQEETIYF